MKVSVIISVYNEENTIGKCIATLAKQTKKHELIIVDDGSIDRTSGILNGIKQSFEAGHISIYREKHQGPGAARNFGATKATGDIFVFVDADMTFDPEFLKNLVNPIEQNLSRGTFTKNEFVANWENIWAKCWNYNQRIPNNRRIPENYPDSAPVFRAILASEFKKVGGFEENTGWTDDWSLSRKLGYQSTATDAVCYHNNPQDLTDIFEQAKWIGKNEFISGNNPKIIYNLLKCSIPVSLCFGIYKSITYREWHFLLFKLVYDFGIICGIIQRLLTGSKNK